VVGTDPLDPSDDDAANSDGTAGEDGVIPGDFSGGKTGCACSTADDSSAPGGMWAGLLAGLAVLGIRRRKD